MAASDFWPEGKAFAFTVFDDPDAQSHEAAERVYGFLHDHGFLTTKAVWPIRGSGTPSDDGATCADAVHREFLVGLQERGFEIAFHGAAAHTSRREETIRGLEAFREYFGADPRSYANHFFNRESMYWGPERLTGAARLAYRALTRGANDNCSFGHVEGHPLFWGDLCQRHIRYVRNFVFADLNVLNCCPYMPYRDEDRPYVNAWFSGAEGAEAPAFLERIAEEAQDRLEEQEGLAIVYTHFGKGFVREGKLDDRFRGLMKRLAQKNGWFVPVWRVLDHLRERRGERTITRAERRALEWRWLAHKARYGSA
jgi:hypothetical protein